MDIKKEYYTVSEIAKKLDTTVVTVRNAIYRGDLKATKPFKYWIVKVEDLESFLKDNEYKKENHKKG